jgi:hypothetical protein
MLVLLEIFEMGSVVLYRGLLFVVGIENPWEAR